MLHREIACQLAATHPRQKLLHAAEDARRAALVSIRLAPAGYRWLPLQTGILPVTLGTRLEGRALRPRPYRPWPKPAAVADWHARAS